MRTISLVIVVTLVTFAAAQVKHAPSLAEQKLCSDAAQKMRDGWGESAKKQWGDDTIVLEHNRIVGGHCIALFRQEIMSTKTQQGSWMVRVIDVFARRPVADYLQDLPHYPEGEGGITVCVVGRVKCSSRVEFNRRVNQNFGFDEDTTE
jgi:hypothetical protein